MPDKNDAELSIVDRVRNLLRGSNAQQDRAAQDALRQYVNVTALDEAQIEDEAEEAMAEGEVIKQDLIEDLPEDVQDVLDAYNDYLEAIHTASAVRYPIEGYRLNDLSAAVYKNALVNANISNNRDVLKSTIGKHFPTLKIDYDNLEKDSIEFCDHLERSNANFLLAKEKPYGDVRQLTDDSIYHYEMMTLKGNELVDQLNQYVSGEQDYTRQMKAYLHEKPFFTHTVTHSYPLYDSEIDNFKNDVMEVVSVHEYLRDSVQENFSKEYEQLSQPERDERRKELIEEISFDYLKDGMALYEESVNPENVVEVDSTKTDNALRNLYQAVSYENDPMEADKFVTNFDASARQSITNIGVDKDMYDAKHVFQTERLTALEREGYFSEVDNLVKSVLPAPIRIAVSLHDKLKAEKLPIDVATQRELANELDNRKEQVKDEGFSALDSLDNGF